jgi:hypothetical protein
MKLVPLLAQSVEGGTVVVVVVPTAASQVYQVLLVTLAFEMVPPK